jgi:hypothetical protein
VRNASDGKRGCGVEVILDKCDAMTKGTSHLRLGYKMHSDYTLGVRAEYPPWGQAFQYTRRLQAAVPALLMPLSLPHPGPPRSS